MTEYRFCPQCGKPLVEQVQFGELRPTCANCGFVYFEDPKVASGVLIEQDDKVLLVRRVYPPAEGRWSIPAGFVNAREDPQAAAVRECLEETGLQVRLTGLANLIYGREHPRGADLMLIYNAVVTGGALKAGDDADEAGFFSRAALPPLAFRATCVALGVNGCEMEE
ncbi:MAG: NUDIX hydrolase [Anaerolineae bacterium]|nr:NUDIX hydrolase [Anaerolineae bacterium]